MSGTFREKYILCGFEYSEVSIKAVSKNDVFRRRYHRLLEGAGIESKGLRSLRHIFATNLVNGEKQADGSIKALTVKQVADLLGHSTMQVTEIYYVKKDISMLNGITNDFYL